MNSTPILRDERTIQVENASYRAGYLVLSYGLLIIVMVRGFFFQQSSWDLLGLVVLGGLVTSFYQYWQHTLTRGWLYLMLATMVLAALAAVVLALLAR